MIDFVTNMIYLAFFILLVFVIGGMTELYLALKRKYGKKKAEPKEE